MQENMSLEFPTRSDTRRAVQPQKMARGLKIQIQEEGLYYLCGENKGTDQLRIYCAADLRLCFPYAKGRFLMTRLLFLKMCRSVFLVLLVGNPEDIIFLRQSSSENCLLDHKYYMSHEKNRSK